jgi:hypothetical protein
LQDPRQLPRHRRHTGHAGDALALDQHSTCT